MKTRNVSVLAAVIMVAATARMSGDTIVGPSLNMAIGGWQGYGIQFTALDNSTLQSFAYPNQGFADVVELVNAATYQVLDSTSISAGNPSATLNVNWSLTSGQSYYLLGTPDGQLQPSDGFFGFYSPASDTDISVTAGAWFMGGINAGSLEPSVGQSYWASFNDLTTGPASSVPDTASTLMLLGSAFGLMAAARRKFQS
jgi:hypothetical protein